MSSGAFLRSRYLANNGGIHPIRVQPETLTLAAGGAANNPPGGETDSRISAKVSGGRRQLGLTARNVSFVWDGAVPEGYKLDGVLRLPLLNPAIYNAIDDGVSEGTISIGGETFDIRFLGLSPETRR